MAPAVLDDVEQLDVLAVLRLEDEGYGASIQREIEERTRRPVSLNAAYTTLDRLERKRLVRSWIGEPISAILRSRLAETHSRRQASALSHHFGGRQGLARLSIMAGAAPKPGETAACTRPDPSPACF